MTRHRAITTTSSPRDTTRRRSSSRLVALDLTARAVVPSPVAARRREHGHDMITKTHRQPSALLALACCLLLAACTDDDGGDAVDGETDTGATEDAETGTDTGDAMSLAIAGSYTDDFGDAHTIGETSWDNGAGSFAISEYDNEAMFLIAQNASTNEFSPDLWSRFDWLFDGEQLYYCQSVYDGATPEDAIAGSADAGSLDMGCAGFAWSMLTPAP